VAGIKTTAVKDGDDYVINGSKMWITNGTQADWVCLLCNTGEPDQSSPAGNGAGGKHGNKSLLVVPLDAKGVDRKTKLDKLGQRSSDTAIIFFDNVRVSASHLVGQQGRGFVYQMEQFQHERLFLSASIIVAMEKCVSETAEYTRQRKAFGGSLLDNQVVQFKLAQMQTELEALRALTYRAVELMLKGEDVTLLASMAKLKAGQLGREVPDACLQYWGGQGFMWENYVAQMYRDLRLHAIGGGADEVMLGIISKRLGFGGKKKA
jgi:citronellyl-CoA dehydrogenase